jgi:hypothetical protein
MNWQSENPDGRREITFIRSGNYTGQLKEMLYQLPRDFGPLSRVKVFTSLDKSLILNSFTAGWAQPSPPKHVCCYRYVIMITTLEIITTSVVLVS